MAHRPVLLVAVLVLLSRPAWSQEPDLRFDQLAPQQFEPFVRRILDSASQSLERLLAMSGPRTVANTLRPYDDYRILANRARVVSHISEVHHDPAIRAAAARAENLLTEHNRARRTDRRVYDMLAAVDTTEADAEVRFWLRRELENFRREAVDRDSSVQARAAELQRELTRLGQQWNENPRLDTITVAFDSSALEGMSREWLAQRARGTGGTILVAGDEMRSVIGQATRSTTRERALRIQMRLRRNHFTLDTMLRVRHALATLLGYRSYAESQLRHSMAGSPERVRAFLDDVRRITEPALRRTIERRAAESGTTGGAIPLHDLAYRVAEPTGVGAALRPYLPYPLVRDGMLQLAREFLGLDFKPAPDLSVWHPTVEPWRVYQDGRLIARVWFDLHWRPGRSAVAAHAANFRVGVRDRSIAEAAIVGGMVRARPGEPPLMGPRPMETLFHEFGHLLHYLLSVRPWFASSGLPDAFDFREVPSILFSEWAKDSAVVARFARHHQTGASAPPQLLGRLRVREREGEFMGQWLARMSLELHDRAPGDMHAVIRETFHQMLPPGLPVSVRLPEGDIHPETTVPHFGNGYDAAYYTYIWSSVIAQDLLTHFDRGLLDSAAVRRYRTHILESGRSRPAAELVENFLGRPFSLDAWARSRAP